jgi:hypothetical protein
MEGNKPKVAFFFGAGAEAPYGLPTGGEFALEIFRTIGAEDKETIKKEIRKISSTSHQAAWLPDGYANNRVTVFGKTNFDSIISSTLEMRRNSVIDAILDFDTAADQAKRQFESLGIKIDDVLTSLGCKPGSEQYSSVIKLNSRLRSTNVDDFFGSTYFSVLAHLIRNKKFSDSTAEDASILARSFVEILIGALGQDLVHSLNNGIFESAPDDLPFLDDIGGIFNLDYRKVGLDALTFILSKQPFSERKAKLNPRMADAKIAIEFYLRVAERIYSTVADYQGLVDSHYRYLYQPRKEWAKFCKISTFLFAVHRYVLGHLEGASGCDGYYEDVSRFSGINVCAAGTSNYTDLIRVLGTTDLFFLNGSLSEFYDPYRNEIVDLSYDSFKVPFLFTQSGTKPMTSIKMSRRYIDFYDKCSQADRIVVLGYGFNSDDGHINTLLRSLLDEHEKVIDVVDYKCQNIKARQRQIAADIRCSNHESIRVHSVEADRSINGQPWLNHLFEQDVQ